MKKLIILRGNSGNGKTTVATALQRKIGYNTMRIHRMKLEGICFGLKMV
jgi:predicted kinase